MLVRVKVFCRKSEFVVLSSVDASDCLNTEIRCVTHATISSK